MNPLIIILIGLAVAAFLWWKSQQKPEGAEKSQKVEAAPKAVAAAPKAVAAAPKAVAAAPKAVAAAPKAVAATVPPPSVAAAPKAVAAVPKESTPPPPETSVTSEETSSDEEEVKARDTVVEEVAAPDAVAEEDTVKSTNESTPPPEDSNIESDAKDESSTPLLEASSAEVVPDTVAEESEGEAADISEPAPPETSATSDQPDVTEEEVKAVDSTTEGRTPEEIDRIRAIFNKFDRDGSGAIDAGEVKDCLGEIGVNLKDEQVDKLINLVDADHSQQIEFPEFIKLYDLALKNLGEPPKNEAPESAPESAPEGRTPEELDRIRAVFNKFDRDESGTIDAGEVKDCLGEIGVNLEDEQVDNLINLVDANNSQQIEFPEFIKLYDLALKKEKTEGTPEAAPDSDAEEDKVKGTDESTPPPAKEEEVDDGFPTPEYENYSELVDVAQGEVPQELTDAVAYLNSLNTSDVDSCQKLMTADTFKYILKAVKGVRNEDGQVEETLPYHALSILAQIHTRGLSRNQRRVAENCAAEFREADGLNVVFDISTSSAHVPSKQLAAVLTAFTFAYEPLPDEYRDILATLMEMVIEYDKDASSYHSPPDPQAHEAERLVALALHALTLLLSHEDNVHLILEDNIGREGPDDGNDGGGSQSTPPHGWRGFSSSSPLPRTLKYDPASPPTNSSSYPADSPQAQRSVSQQGEIPDLPLSMLQEKIYELISSDDRNVSAWAIRFYAVQALHMTLNEKRAFVHETGFFDKARELVTLPLNDETLPVVENIILAMYNLCLKRYDKGKSFILKTGIAKELFTNLVRVDFKALSNPVRGRIKPLEDEGISIPDSLVEPLTALSPPNALFTADEQSRFVDHQVHIMGIVEHTFAVFRSFSHNIMALEYLIKIGIATPISNILHNYNRKLTHDDQILEDAAEESYGRFLANALELFRYLAAVGVDEVIQGKSNELRASLEKISAMKVLENLLTSLPWDSFDYTLELKELEYTHRSLLDLAFVYPALYVADDAPEEARPAFEFINNLRASDSPLYSPETPSLYVKYYKHLFSNVNNADSF